MYKSGIKYKNLIIGLLLIIIIYDIIKDPTMSIASAKEGLNIWLNILIPSLFPFIFITDLLISLGLVSLITRYLEPIMMPLFGVSGVGIFPLSMSIMSGYPVGSRITSKLSTEGLVTAEEANRLICFTSTSGPLYILGTVGTGMLGLPELGLLLLLPHYLGAFTNGFFLKLYPGKKMINVGKDFPYKNKSNMIEPLSFGSIISNSIREGMESMLMIGGLVIIFSVIIDIVISSPLFNLIIGYISSILDIDSSLIKGMVAGIIEITNGCSLISKLEVPIIDKLILTNFIIGWGGFSVHSQAISFISKSDIKASLYLLSKLFHGLFSSIYTYLIYSLFYKDKLVNVFKPLGKELVFNIKSWLEILTSSSLNILCLSLFILILSILVNEVSQRA